MKVSVSILNEYERLINSVIKVNQSNADFLHIDVMDGIFVKNNKFPLEVVNDICKINKKPLDIHMMVNDYNTIIKYSFLNPAYLTLHVEILKDDSIIKFLKQKDIKVGLAINPSTSIEKLKPYLNQIDLILFMSVVPGYPGQQFEMKVLDKVKEIKKIIPSNVLVSIDGGINSNIINLCKEAEIDIVVSGSFITNCDNYDENIKKLKY